MKRNPALFFVTTWLPYVVSSVAMSSWVGRVDGGAILFAIAASAGLAGLLAVVHEVEYQAPSRAAG